MDNLITDSSTFNITDSGTTIVHGSDIVNFIFNNYYDWSIACFAGTNADAYTYVKNAIAAFIAEIKPNVVGVYNALSIQYDPNTDFSRRETTAYKNTRETEYGHTTTNTATDYTSETTYNSGNTSDVTTYDSSLFRNGARDSHDGYDTTVINGSTENVESGTDTTTDTRLAADNVRDISGVNTSPAANISRESELRLKYNLTFYAANLIATRFLFLPVGD